MYSYTIKWHKSQFFVIYIFIFLLKTLGYVFCMDWNSKTTAKHILEAEAVGLKLFGIGNNRRTRKYSFGACGHTQDISPGHVRKNRFRCRACQEIKLVDEAERAGLMLISIAQNSNYRIYQFKTCGHQQPITLAAVRNKEFKCKYCLREKHGAEAQKKRISISW